jgi:hypothetical protein
MAAFSIHKAADPQDLWIADRRLWLTSDQSEPVEDGDPRAAFLLIAPGQSMLRARAEELGVIRQPTEVSDDAATHAGPESEKTSEPDAGVKEKEKTEDKQRAKPRTKSRKKATKKKKTA